MRWLRLPLLLLALTGCAGGAACPLIGCSSQLTVRLPAGATSGTACVDGVCSSTVVDGSLQVPLSRRAEGGTVAVTVTLPATAGSGYEGEHEGEVVVERTRPNGAGCPPVCVNGTAEVEPGTGRVIAADAAPPTPTRS